VSICHTVGLTINLKKIRPSKIPVTFCHSRLINFTIQTAAQQADIVALQFLADRTNGRAYATVLRLSVRRL